MEKTRLTTDGRSRRGIPLPDDYDGPPLHDYTYERNGWGHNLYVNEWSADYKQIKVMGIGYGVEVGDDVLLTMNRLGGGTMVNCYRVGPDLRYSHNPRDMWHASMEYQGELDDDGVAWIRSVRPNVLSPPAPREGARDAG